MPNTPRTRSLRALTALSALIVSATLGGCTIPGGAANVAAPQASSAAPAASSVTPAAVAPTSATSSASAPATASVPATTPAPPATSVPATSAAPKPVTPVAAKPAAPATPAKPATPVGLGQLSMADRQAWAEQDYSVYSGPHRGDTVMLTYDDCPTDLDSFKQTVLAVEKLGVTLALFPTGECFTFGNFDSRFARAHGMYVFNHGNKHLDFKTLSFAEAQREIGKGVNSTWARPPYGDLSQAIRDDFAAQGMRLWIWDLDTEDWNGHKSQSTIVNWVTENAYPGATVLMHMQEHAFNPTALKQMKDGLAARGIEVCANHGPVEQYPRALNC